MSDQQHQQRPITQKLQESMPDSRRTVKFLTAATMGAVLLGLSGLTLTGTVICLILATPLLVIFSPVLVPAAITVFMLTSGFLFSGGCGVAALSAVSWMYRYLTGKHLAEKVDRAKERFTGAARDVKDRAKEHGQYLQQKAQDVTQGS